MKKNKLLISSLSAFSVVATAMSALPLSSCSKTKNSSEYIFGEDLDKEYDVNESTYIALQEKLKAEWNNIVQAHDDWTPQRRAREISNLNNDLNLFDKSFKSNDFKLSYTMKSQAIINFAMQHYGINIRRDNLKVDWSDIYNIYLGYKKSFRTYMTSAGISPAEADRILEISDGLYTELMEGKVDNYDVGLKQKYKDPLAALVEAKALLVSCFAQVNDDIALQAAIINLQRFFQTYDIKYARTDSNAFDQLTDAGIISKDKIGSDLSEHVSKIFHITDTLHPDRQLANFDGTKFIPGYTIKPVLYAIHTDRYTNKYSIDVDWQCVKTDFIGQKTPEELKGVTGHIFNGAGDPNMLDQPASDNMSLVDFFKVQEIHPLTYSIPLTAEAEKEALKSAYFDGTPFKYDSTTPTKGMISLGWFSDPEPGKTHEGYDVFMQGKVIDDTKNSDFTHYQVSLGSLLDADIEFKYAEANSNTLSEPAKMHDYLTSSSTGVVEQSEESETRNTPEILKALLHNCSVYADAMVKNEDWTARTVSTTLNVSYKNTPYIHRNDSNILSFGPFNTSGFGNSTSTYKWLTREYNNLASLAERVSNNELKEKWEAAKQMCINTSIFFSLGTALNILCIGAGIYTFKKSKSWFFWVDAAFVVATQIVDTISYATFMSKYYTPTKHAHDKIEEVRKSKEVKALVDFLKEQQQVLGLVRADKNNDIKRDVFYDNYEKHFKNLTPQDVKARRDLFASFRHNQIMIDFLTKVASEGPELKTYEEYMEEWEEEGKYQEKTGKCALASAVLCGLMLIWTGYTIAATPVKTVEEKAVDEGTKTFAATEEKIIEEQKSLTTGDAPTSNGETVTSLLEENTENLPPGTNPEIPHEEPGNVPEPPVDPKKPEVSDQQPATGNDLDKLSPKDNVKSKEDYFYYLRTKYNKGTNPADYDRLKEMVEEDIMPKIFKDPTVTSLGDLKSQQYITLFPNARSAKKGLPTVYSSPMELLESAKNITADPKVNEELFEDALLEIDTELRKKGFIDETTPDLIGLYKSGKNEDLNNIINNILIGENIPGKLAAAEAKSAKLFDWAAAKGIKGFLKWFQHGISTGLLVLARYLKIIE